jgi:ketosteroid isomerase-like protein
MSEQNTTQLAHLSQAVLDLQRRLDRLEAEAEVRRIQARYMFLCDTPCPEPVADDAERIEKILALYAEDAVWEGVGSYYTGQFGRAEGKAAIRAHFQNFWGGKKDPALLLNVHYLTSEQIHVHADGLTADGQWVHCQPWIFSDGKSLLRSSRLNNLFKKVDGVWKIARTRTENVFVAPLPNNYAEAFPSQSVLMRN